MEGIVGIQGFPGFGAQCEVFLANGALSVFGAYDKAVSNDRALKLLSQLRHQTQAVISASKKCLVFARQVSNQRAAAIASLFCTAGG